MAIEILTTTNTKVKVYRKSQPTWPCKGSTVIAYCSKVVFS